MSSGRFLNVVPVGIQSVRSGLFISFAKRKPPTTGSSRLRSKTVVRGMGRAVGGTWSRGRIYF